MNNKEIYKTTEKIVDLIKQQSNRNKVIAIIYEKSSENPEEWRFTEPYEIKDEKYYYGYDIKKDDHIRRFNIDSIAEAKPTNLNFEPRWEVKL